MIHSVVHNDQLLALLIRQQPYEPGVHFVTPPQFGQQLAFLCHPAGTVIDAHVHTPVVRVVEGTQEVLVIQRGKLRVDFYDADRQYLFSHVLHAGDVALLTGGGHGFEVLEDVEIIEVKQGPFRGEIDKIRFPGITTNQVHVPE